MNKPRVAIQQRVLPSYRVSFFEMLSKELNGQVSIFYGKPKKSESILSSIVPENLEVFTARNIHILKGKTYLCWQLGLINWLEKWKPEILIMEANPRYLGANFAIKWMHSKHKKVIGWGLGSPEPTGFFPGLRKWLRSRFIKKFDALITYSQKGAFEYHHSGFDNEKIFVAPNAVAAAPKQNAIERPEKFEMNRAIILFVGRLQSRKNVDLLIHACSQVENAEPPMLWIVGDGPERNSLELLAKDVYPETQFFGAQYGKDLHNLFERADLFVLPGTGGLAVQEAMSFSLPVIVGEADGTQSNMVSNKNGWILEKDNANELTKLIDTALSNLKTLRRKGLESYKIVKDEINLEIMVGEFIRVIDLVSGAME